MNVWALIAGVFTFIAFAIHTFIGTKEFWQFKPDEAKGKPYELWLQAMAGWQFASVDLLVSAIIFLLIATTNYITGESRILLLMGVYFFLVGSSWLSVVGFIGSGSRSRFYKLGQWMLCYLLSVLSFAGAQLGG